MGFCLPKEFAQKFTDALKSGKINPDELADMTSQERRDFLEPYVGKDDVHEVNAQLESKLILQDQKRGMVSWAKKVAGITPEVRADLITKINRIEKVLTPEDQNAFLEDLAAKRLGVEVTPEEAKTIADFARHITDLKDDWTGKNWKSEESRLQYGATKVALQNYIDEIKLGKGAKTLKGMVDAAAEEFKASKAGAIGKAIDKLAGITKGIQASLDNSALFRQGWRTLFTDNGVWRKNAMQSFRDIAQQIGRNPSNNEVLNGVKAEIYSRPNAMNGLYDKMKLDIGMNEEAYPTTIPEKIPLFGNLYKASEVAYTGFLYRMRADIADKYVKMADNAGIDMTDQKQVRSIGKLVNSLTGRGDLGKLEQVGKQINSIFFSPKNLWSQVEFLTAHQLDPSMSVFARKAAAVNLLKAVAGTALVLGTAQAILGKDAVELDPRSSDFGKIKIGDTRFDVTGGAASIVTLAARLLPLVAGQKAYTKSGSKLTQINAKDKKGNPAFGAKTGWDVVVDFATNKASPLASVMIDIMRGHDFSGNKPTPLNEAKNLFTPLPISNGIEVLKDPNGANPLLTMIADGLGIATNTYAPTKKK